MNSHYVSDLMRCSASLEGALCSCSWCCKG